MQLQEDQTTSSNRIVLSPDYTLPYKANPESYPLKYGVVFTIDNGKATNEIKYELEIKQVKSTYPGTRQFLIDRISDVYINGITCDLLAEQLAYEAGKVFYPLIVEIDRTGKFIRVANYQEIKKRWLSKRESLVQYFSGEAATKYIALMDAAIGSEPHINTTISCEPLISIYFNGIYKSYSPKLTIINDVVLPITGTTLQAAYQTHQTISAELNSFGAIEIKHSGKLTDNRSIDDFEQGLKFALSKFEQPNLPSADGDYNGLYILNAKSNLIEAAILNWTIHLSETKSFNFKLFELGEVKNLNKVSVINKQHVLIEPTPKNAKRDGGIFSKFMESLFGK